MNIKEFKKLSILEKMRIVNFADTFEANKTEGEKKHMIIALFEAALWGKNHTHTEKTDSIVSNTQECIEPVRDRIHKKHVAVDIVVAKKAYELKQRGFPARKIADIIGVEYKRTAYLIKRYKEIYLSVDKGKKSS
jgi:orotate phosphoribosyltransferase-like protein